MQFEITDPTMLWCSVAAILFGLFFIVIAIYKECRYTKKIKKDDRGISRGNKKRRELLTGK